MNIADSKRLTNEGAKKMMQAAVAKASASGAAVTIAIVDAGGHLVLLERMEGSTRRAPRQHAPRPRGA